MNRRKFGEATLLGIGSAALLTPASLLAAPPAELGSNTTSHIGVTSLGPDSSPSDGSADAIEEGNGADLEVRVVRTIEITSSCRYCWFPTVHRLANGAIMATMRMSPDEINPEGDFSAYCISEDGGLTWSRRYTMGAGANVDGAWSSLPQKDGRIWQLYSWLTPYPEGQNERFHGILTKFGKGGTEIEQARDAVISLSRAVQMAPTQLFGRRGGDGLLRKQAIALPWGPIIEGLNGDLIALLYYATGRDSRKYRLILMRSSDDGKTWTEFSTVASVEPNGKPWPWMGKEGPCEAGLVRLDDKRLYVIFRTGADGFMGQTWSSDDGKTWSLPTSTSYKGVAPRIRRLSNGVLACTYGRPGPVTIMFSVDGTGKKWSHITPIFSGMSTRYTDFIEVAPGRLFMVYDSVPYGWDPIPESDTISKNTIYAKVIEVQKV
ncbi:MAG: sialidase family protein [Terriglobia bacterium]